MNPEQHKESNSLDTTITPTAEQRLQAVTLYIRYLYHKGHLTKGEMRNFEQFNRTGVFALPGIENDPITGF